MGSYQITIPDELRGAVERGEISFAQARGMRQIVKKKIKATHDVEVGAIYVSTWGYEQTNVDFYQVVRTTPTMVVLRPIQKRVTEVVSSMSEMVEPVADAFTGEAFRVKVHIKYGNAVYLNSFSAAHPWDGTPKNATHYA